MCAYSQNVKVNKSNLKIPCLLKGRNVPLIYRGFKKWVGNRGYTRGNKNINKQVMRNRNRANSLLDRLDGVLASLEQIVNRQEPIETYKKAIEKAHDVVDDLRTVVEQEPMSASELNKR